MFMKTKVMLSLAALSLCTVGALTLAGCSTAPTSETAKQTQQLEVNDTMNRFRAQPGVSAWIDRAYGYAVFPTVGKGGAGVGGAYGRGQVFEQGRMVGYCDVSQGSIGLQLGGQSFSQLILFENKTALDRF